MQSSRTLRVPIGASTDSYQNNCTLKIRAKTCLRPGVAAPGSGQASELRRSNPRISQDAFPTSKQCPAFLPKSPFQGFPSLTPPQRLQSPSVACIATVLVLATQLQQHCSCIYTSALSLQLCRWMNTTFGAFANAEPDASRQKAVGSKPRRSAKVLWGWVGVFFVRSFFLKRGVLGWVAGVLHTYIGKGFVTAV